MTRESPDGPAASSRTSGQESTEAPSGPGPGSVFGRYRLVRLLARGGRGSVFEAVHSENGLPFAVKVLGPGAVHDAATESRFRRQAEAIARLRHPNLVDIAAFGHDRGT